MTEYVVKSFHDLLAGDSELLSDSDSSRGSHHPSRECFMAGTPEGRVESVHEGGATPPNDLDDEVEEDAGALPRMRVEQLRAQHQELEDARLQLEQERTELEREIEHHGDGGQARTMAMIETPNLYKIKYGCPHLAH